MTVDTLFLLFSTSSYEMLAIIQP